MIKNFSIFKNSKKENPNQPDYKISVKVGDAYVECGGGWIKEGKTSKFISCKLSDSFNDRAGFHIEQDGHVSSLSEGEKKDIVDLKTKAGFYEKKEEIVLPDEIDF